MDAGPPEPPSPEPTSLDLTSPEPTSPESAPPPAPPPRRRIPRWRRYVVFAPSVAMGLIGAVWLLFRPLRLEAEAGPAAVLAAALLLAAGLLAGAWLLERTLPSFRFASRLLERALIGFDLGLPASLLLAGATAVSEELFFRGALLPLIGVWGQALLFGLLHPATRRGWSYTAYTFVAGLAFGYATLVTGSLWAAVLAHFLINLQGFTEIRRRKRATAGATVSPPVPKPPG